MRCTNCLSSRAYTRKLRGWKRLLWLPLLPFLVPMFCRHCFHEFWYPRILTFNKQITPPERDS